MPLDPRDLLLLTMRFAGDRPTDWNFPSIVGGGQKGVEEETHIGGQ